MTAHTADTKFTFRFNKAKDGTKRPSLELNLPTPTSEGLIHTLQHGSQAEINLILESIHATVRAAAASIIAADTAISQETFPFNKVSLHGIATTPKSERAVIPVELWDAFEVSYKSTMEAVSDRTPQQIANAFEVYKRKFAPVQGNTSSMEKLRGQLALYLESAADAENFTTILSMLLDKLDEMLRRAQASNLADNV